MRDAGAMGDGEGVQGADLVEHVGAYLVRCQVHGAPPEPDEVGEAGVGADADTAADTGADRGVHDPGIARVESAGYVCRGEQGEQCFVVAHPVRAEAFAEVGDKINCKRHSGLRRGNVG